jgi:N-acetylmuramoyl-L-alanine amidase
MLVETGFLTNKHDAKLLRSAKYQREIAEAIAEGVDRYRQQIEMGLASSSIVPPGTR